MNRLIHEVTAGLAERLVEIISPLLGFEERQEALRAFYAAIRVDLEAFLENARRADARPGPTQVADGRAGTPSGEADS